MFLLCQLFLLVEAGQRCRNDMRCCASITRVPSDVIQQSVSSACRPSTTRIFPLRFRRQSQIVLRAEWLSQSPRNSFDRIVHLIRKEAWIRSHEKCARGHKQHLDVARVVAHAPWQTYCNDSISKFSLLNVEHPFIATARWLESWEKFLFYPTTQDFHL